MWKDQSPDYERFSGGLDKACIEDSESLFLQRLLVEFELFLLHDSGSQVEPQGGLFPTELQKCPFQGANWKPAGGDIATTRND